MVSTLKLEFDLSKEINGYLLEDKDLSNFKLEKTKLYVPVLMPKIELGEPTEKILETRGQSVFRNDIGKPNVSAELIKEVNYFESDITGTNAIQNMEASTSVTKKNFHKWIKESTGIEASKLKDLEPKLTYEVEKFTMCRCSFLNGKLNKLSFTPNDNDVATVTPKSDIKK